jgi:hypothetical protein
MEEAHLGHPGVERLGDVVDWILLAQDIQHCRYLQNRQCIFELNRKRGVS